jgi:hypothetical protein
MSHFSRIRTQFVDKDLLEKAIQDLGYEVEEGELLLNGFGGNKTFVDLKIPLRLSYDIGFKWRGDHFEIIADWFGVRGVKQKEFEQKLNQRYAYQAARAKMEQQGFDLVEEAEQNGQIHLVLRRAA